MRRAVPVVAVPALTAWKILPTAEVIATAVPAFVPGAMQFAVSAKFVVPRDTIMYICPAINDPLVSTVDPVRSMD
jgi:hypothetical protein